MLIFLFFSPRTQDNEARLAAYFPSFLWVVRDFTLQLKGNFFRNRVHMLEFLVCAVQCTLRMAIK